MTQDVENPSYRRNSNIGKLSKKKPQSSYQLSAEGENHLGYIFATFATSYEAKKALYVASQNFDFLSENLDPEHRLKISLKNK